MKERHIKLNKEIWEDIKGYEGLYQVSNLGRVKALDRYKINNGGKHLVKEHIMKPNTHGTCDYHRVGLTDNNGTRKYHTIHKLVATAFIENNNNHREINHKDGNKHNNCVDNLEWCTRSYNIRHAYDNGLRVTIKDLVNEIDKLNKRIEKLENEQNCYKIGD